MSQMQPACHGKYISNEYFLTVRTDMIGCTCALETPMAKIPLVVVPMVNPSCYGFTAPADYKPQMQNAADITLTAHQ